MSARARALRRCGAGYNENRSVPSVADSGATRYQALRRKSLPELLDVIEASGWLVNNMFQIGEKLWRCNLRYIIESRDQVRTYFHEFSDAPTAVDAAASAIWNMEQRRNDATRAAGVVNADTKPANLAVLRGAPSAEVTYREEWKPEIEAAMGLLARDIAHLRAQLKKWTYVL